MGNFKLFFIVWFKRELDKQSKIVRKVDSTRSKSVRRLSLKCPCQITTSTQTTTCWPLPAAETSQPPSPPCWTGWSLLTTPAWRDWADFWRSSRTAWQSSSVTWHTWPSDTCQGCPGETRGRRGEGGEACWLFHQYFIPFSLMPALTLEDCQEELSCSLLP